MWPTMSIPRDRGHNDIRLDLLQFLVAKSKPFHDAGSEVVHHHVTFAHQLFGNSDAFWRTEIDEGALLALAPLIEIGASVNSWLHSLGIHRQSSCQIKMMVRFNLDNFRAQITEMHRTERSCPHPGEVC